MHLQRIDSITKWVDELTARIETQMEPFQAAREFLSTICEVSNLVADVIIARNRCGHAHLRNPGPAGSLGGWEQGSNEFAGRLKSTKTRPGNRYLKGALGTVALSIAKHSKNSYLGARYKRIVVRRGKMKAIVAIEHSTLTAVWHLLAEGECCHDPRSDFFTRKDPTHTKINAIRRLHELGSNVILTTPEAARTTPLTF